MKIGYNKIIITFALTLLGFCVGGAEGGLWLRLTFNEHKESQEYDTLANDGGSSQYFGQAYNIDYVDSQGDTAASFKNVGYKGVGNYVAIKKSNKDVLPKSLAENGMSIAYWIKFDVTEISYMTLLSTCANSGNENIQHFLKYSSTDSPYKQRYFTNFTSGNVKVNTDKWYHLVWTVEGVTGNQTEKFYVDGQLIKAITGLTMKIGQAFGTRLGAVWNGKMWSDQFSGEIDQLDIYDHTLSDIEVMVLHWEGPRKSGQEVNAAVRTMNIINDFEKSGDWSVFESNLDDLFTNDKEAFEIWAPTIAGRLEKKDIWLRKFVTYLRDKTNLIKFYLKTGEKLAESYVQQGYYSKAVQLYQEMAERSKVNEAVYKLKICQSTMCMGQYDKAISEIENFVNSYKVSHDLLVKKSLMMKGQIYVQLGQLNNAIDTFELVQINSQEGNTLTEAIFFIGYCNMLQGKKTEATDYFNSVLEGSSNSEYVSKAQWCINHIENSIKL